MERIKNITNIFRSRLVFKVALPALLVMILFGVPVYYAHQYLQVSEEYHRELLDHSLMNVGLVNIRDALEHEKGAADKVVSGGGPQAIESYRNHYTKVEGLEQSVAAYYDNVSRPGVMEGFQRLHGDTGEYINSTVIPAWQANGATDLQTSEEGGVLERYYGRMAEELNLLFGLCMSGTDRVTVDYHHLTETAGRSAVISLAAAVFLSFSMIVIMARRITQPVKRLSEAAAVISRGDLNQRLEVSTGDELGRMAEAFNDMAGSLERRTTELENSRERIERNSAELETLNSINKAISSSLDLETVLDRAAARLLEASKADAVFIHIQDSSTGDMVLTTSRGLPDAVKDVVRRLPQGQGCPGYVVETGEAVVMGDLCQSPDAAQAVRDAGLHAYGGAPFYLKNGNVGVLSMLAAPLDAFSQDEARLLMLIGNQVAVAVDNADLYRQSEENARKTQAKGRIVAALAASLDIHEVYDDFAAGVKKLVDFDCISIMRALNNGMIELVASTGTGPADCPPGGSFPAKDTPMSRVIKNRSPYLCNDIDSRRLEFPSQKFLVSKGYRSQISLPLIAKDRVMGTLNMASRKAGAFDQADLEELAPVVGQVALAVANQGLFEDVASAKKEWETTFDSVDEGIVIVDNDHTVVRINHAAARMMGGTVEGFLNRDCCEVLYGLDGEVGGCHDDLPLEDLGATISEQQTADGRMLEVAASSIFDAGGNRSGAVYLLRDITEAVQLRQQLVQSEKMVAVGELVSGVAHEINNPLTGVIGYAQLLLSRDIDEKAKKDAEGIFREAERATRIIRQLLSFARKHEPVRRSVDVNAVVNESLGLKAYDLRVNNVRVETFLDEALPVTAADPHQLQQVFINLMTNAEQAMLEKGNGGLLKIASRKAGDNIQVRFADDGPGIPEEARSRVFDPFFTTKGVGKGTGLGLSVCYGLIQDHGGRIWAEPTPGGGATFVVELPVVDNVVVTEGKAPLPETSACLGRILLVDDEVAIRQALTKILRQAGHQVETAENGEAALAMLKQARYDCVVSDVKMPRMDGPTLHREARTLDPRLAGNFIFISGDIVNPETQTYLDTVKNPHLIKPFSAEDLDSVLQKVLGCKY